jgi:predicted kinase
MKSLQLPTPRLIIMVGIPGSGKTFFGEHFAKTFGAPYVSEYDLIEQAAIDREAANLVGQSLLHELLKTQRTFVFDGTTGARHERQELAKHAKDAGYAPLFVWVQTESAAARMRAQKRSHHGGLSDDQFDTIIKHFSPPHTSEKAVVISGKHTYPSQLKIVLKRLVEPRDPSTRTMPPARPISERPKLVR